MTAKDFKIPEFKIGELLIKNIKWSEGRNFQEVHGINIIGQIGNLPLNNCIIKIFPKQKKALILRDNEIIPGERFGIQWSWDDNIITSVLPNSVADKIGIKKGDRVTKINAFEISNAFEMRNAISHWNNLQPIKVTVLRSNESKILSTQK